MLSAMNRRPLVWIAASWVCGSAAAAGLGLRGVALAAGAVALLAVAGAAGRLATGRLAALCLLAFCLAAGQRLWADERNATSLEPLLAAAEAAGPGAAFGAAATGTIVSAVEVDGDRATFRMEADAVHAEGVAPPLEAAGGGMAARMEADADHAREMEQPPEGEGELLLVQLRLAAQPEQDIAAAWQRGDHVTVAGELTRPATATNSGGFDYRRYLSSQRIHWLLKAKGADSVTVVPESKLNAAALLGRVDEARAALGARLSELYPSHQSGYMQGLILGLREGLDPERFEQFAKLGLTHILAISGLHVAVFMIMLEGLLRIARISRERIQLSLIATIPLYVLLTGASPSVLRAGIMAMLGLAAARLGKLRDGLHLLAAAAIAILAYDPYYLDSVSFQLSFAVTFGLICGVPPLRQLLPRRKGLGWLCDLVAVTVAAQLVSFPLTIYYFNGFHLLSLAANFALVPFISFVILPIGTAALLLSPAWFWGAQKLADLSSMASDWTFRAVERMAAAENLRLIWETPPLWWVAGYMAVLFTMFNRLRQLLAEGAIRQSSDSIAVAEDEPTLPLPVSPSSGTNLSAGNAPFPFNLRTSLRQRYRSGHIQFIRCAIALAVLIAFAYYPNPFDRTAAVSFLDVGQGDAVLIRTPSGQHILIDGGGTLSYRKPGDEWRERSDPFEVGRKVVVPLLMKRGVKQIDSLIISHLDSDHIRGLAAVVHSIPVKSVWWNGTMKPSEDAESLMALIIKKGIPLYAPRAGDMAIIDKATTIHMLWPPKTEAPDIVPLEEQNESSLVMSIDIYGHRFLLAGDIGTVTEGAIIAALQRSESSSDSQSILPVHADVMKISHHGSRYSTGEEWLNYWQPRGAVVSVGATNTYGHPHPDTLARIGRSKAKLWRTDTGGEAAFRITPRGLYYSTK